MTQNKAYLSKISMLEWGKLCVLFLDELIHGWQLYSLFMALESWFVFSLQLSSWIYF